jgi:hypothetical protein
MSLIQRQNIKVVNEKVKVFFKNTIDEYNIKEAESIEELLEKFKYESLYEFIIDKYLQDMTNNTDIEFDIVDYIDLDFINTKLMTYMIEYIHNIRTNDYDMPEALTDYSIENIMRQYTYHYSREIEEEFFEELFEDLFTRNSIIIK